MVLGKKDGPKDGVIDGFALGSNDRLDVGYAIGGFDESKAGTIDGVPLGSSVGKTVGSCVSEENTVLLNERYDDGPLGEILEKNNGTIDGVTDDLAFCTKDRLDDRYPLGSFDGSEVGSVGKTVESRV